MTITPCLPQGCGRVPGCASHRDVYRQRQRGTKGRYTARQGGNAPVVADSDAGFVYCAPLVVNPDLAASFGSCRCWRGSRLNDKKWHCCEHNEHEVVNRPRHRVSGCDLLPDR